MKKIYVAAIVFLSCLFAWPTDAASFDKLRSYVKGQSNQTNFSKEVEPKSLADELEDAVSKMGQNSTLELDPQVQQQVATVLQQDIPPGPEIVSDVHDYIKDQGKYASVGKLDSWEAKRIELFSLIQNSNWYTRKGISEADKHLLETVKTVFFGLIKEAANALGWDFIFDRLEQKTINNDETNELVKYAIQNANQDIKDLANEDDHSLHEMYIQVQHNAFNLVLMNHLDYQKLVKAYPEVEFLFEDLYTFFKWRSELNAYEPGYKLNENNIHVEFRNAEATNSFFAWWELASIAKVCMRQAVEQGKQFSSNFSSTDERDSMGLYDAYAGRALYFSRVWNGLQRYAVNHKALPRTLYPKRGAFKIKIRQQINKDLQGFSNEQMVQMLDEIRADYVQTRRATEQEWNQWLEEQIQTQQQQETQQELEKSLASVSAEN